MGLAASGTAAGSGGASGGAETAAAGSDCWAAAGGSGAAGGGGASGHGLANGRGGIAARRDRHHLRARRQFWLPGRRGCGAAAAVLPTATLCFTSSARAKGNSR